jgi:hypothetical protein
LVVGCSSWRKAGFVGQGGRNGHSQGSDHAGPLGTIRIISFSLSDGRLLEAFDEGCFIQHCGEDLEEKKAVSRHKGQDSVSPRLLGTN